MNTADEVSGDTLVRGSLRLLLDPVVGPFFLGRLLSTSGAWAQNIAAAIVVFQLTSSATLVGVVSVAQFVPQLLLTPWSGARADRGDRRRQLVVGRLVAAAGSAALVVWIMTVELEGMQGAVAVIVSGFIVGIGMALGNPAMQALVPSMVRPSELATAVALNNVPVTLGRAGGPALGAVLVAAGGPAWAFGTAAATQLAFVVILVFLRIRDTGFVPMKDTRIRAGVRYLRTDPAVAAILLGTAAVGIGADPVVTLTPSIAEGFGGGPSLVGAFASAFGIGAAVAYFVLGRLRNILGLPRLASAGLMLLAVGLGALAVAPNPATGLAFMGLAGAGMTLSLTAFTTLLQQRSPEHLRGRLMALWAVAFVGSRPLAAVLNGAVADAASATVSLLMVVTVVLLATWFARPSRVDPPLESTTTPRPTGGPPTATATGMPVDPGRRAGSTRQEEERDHA